MKPSRRILPGLLLLALAGGLAALWLRKDVSGPHSTDVPVATLVTDLRVEEPGLAHEFTDIIQIVADANAIYVKQRTTTEVRVFDLEGRHLRTIGRAGGGPGEFRELIAIGLLGDTLWTIDWTLRRFSYFTTAGDLLATTPFESADLSLEPGSPLLVPYPQTVLPHGTALGFGSGFGHSLAEGLITERPILRMTRTALTTDTIARLSVRNNDLIVRTGGSTMFMPQPFTDALFAVHAPLAQRVYVIERWAATASAPAEYGVTALHVNGDTAWSKRYAYTPVPIPKEVTDSVRLRHLKWLRPQFATEDVERALFLPAFRTPVTHALAGDDGTLWIRREEIGENATFVILDADGRERTHVTAPRRAKLLWASGDTAWGYELDEDDVPTLVRYRVAR